MKSPDNSRTAEALLSLERAINEHWNKDDVDDVLEMYSDHVTYFDPHAEVRLHDRKAGELYFRQIFEGRGRWRVTHVNRSFTRHPGAIQGLMS